MEEGATKKHKPGRPEWIFRRGELGCRTSRHMFIGERIAGRSFETSQAEAFAEACVAWREAPGEVRAQMAQRAKISNATAKLFKESALRAAKDKQKEASTEFPLSVSDVEGILNTKSRGLEACEDLGHQWYQSVGRGRLPGRSGLHQRRAGVTCMRHV